MKNSRGFTLIELLVVISVISILVGVVIPRFKGMQDEANRAKAKAELKTLQTAVESYYINNQAYPDSTTTICETYLNSASPVIVSTPLYDPFEEGDDEYIYIQSQNGLYYLIYSVGPNDTPDITDIGDDGYLTGADEDDIYVTNGLGWEP